jgi:predicted ArsR family transcriptional regulator
MRDSKAAIPRRQQTPSPSIEAPGLSRSQVQVLEALKRGGDSTIPDLATRVGLNVETVRHHLRALESHGYAYRRGTRIRRAGRPEIVYGLTAAAENLFPRREGEVLRALAQYLKASGSEGVLEEFFDSYIDARRAAAHARVEGLTGDARVAEVAAILSELGFMASATPTAPAEALEAVEAKDAPMLHLCHCPLRDLVDVSRVPCRAELGFIRELLGEPLTRLAYIPAGDRSCSYRIPA